MTSFARTLLAAAVSLTALPALAQSTLDDTMAVSAEVVGACSDLTANDLDFGSAPASDIDDDETAIINVTCNDSTSYTVELDYGIQPNGLTRRVADDTSGQFMSYVVFKPAAGGAAATTTPWGTEADELGSSYTGTGSGTAQALTASGRLSRTASNTSGTYTDLITVTLTY